jgi:chromosome partitioning protein
MGTQFEDAGISFLNTRIVEREAFKGVVNFGATLADLTEDQVPGLIRLVSTLPRS